MSFFSDDSSFLTTNLSLEYLTKDSLGITWDTLCVSGVIMTKNELNHYSLTINDPFSYKLGIIAKHKDKVVGFGLFSDFEVEVFLNHLYVSPKYRFQGIGSKIMKEIQKYAGKREISFIDFSNNYMPWMDILSPEKKGELSRKLGSFYT